MLSLKEKRLLIHFMVKGLQFGSSYGVISFDQEWEQKRVGFKELCEKYPDFGPIILAAKAFGYGEHMQEGGIDESELKAAFYHFLLEEGIKL
jgi:hypothetical protein